MATTSRASSVQENRSLGRRDQLFPRCGREPTSNATQRRKKRPFPEHSCRSPCICENRQWKLDPALHLFTTARFRAFFTAAPGAFTLPIAPNPQFGAIL